MNYQIYRCAGSQRTTSSYKQENQAIPPSELPPSFVPFQITNVGSHDNIKLNSRKFLQIASRYEYSSEQERDNKGEFGDYLETLPI